MQPLPARDPDAVVIGSGPNGLAAACTLAKAGLRVVVFEANPERAGGAVGTDEATLPGYRHDVGAAFFPWAGLSPAFRSFGLSKYGLEWCRAEFESCHPAPDGSYAAITRNNDHTAKHFGSPADGDRFRTEAAFYQRIEADLLPALMEPFPALTPATRLLPRAAVHLARVFGSSGRRLARRWFRTAAAQRVLPGLALHVDVGPDDLFGAALGYMLAMTGTTGGYVVPKGGAQALTDALVACLGEHGGSVVLGARVDRVLVRDGRAVGVALADGTEIAADRVFADTDVAALLLQMVDRNEVPSRFVDFLRDYPRGWGTFKMDWALAGPVPWQIEVARRSAVVHAGDSLADLSRFTAQVRRGDLPDDPYLVIGQQSLLDPTRAPPSGHTLWAYSRVPSLVSGGWANHERSFADRVERRIEALAPGFRALIRARRIVSPLKLSAMDANLVGGDLGGGSNAWHRQLLFRPVFPYFRYQMPLRGLYLCSSYAHPGAGVHGMCGFNAARVALATWERRATDES